MENKTNDPVIIGSLLPKKLENSHEGKDILMALNSHLRSVKQWNDLVVPSFGFSESVINSLHSARRSGRLTRGLEDAEKKLSAEKAGIANIDIKTGSQRNERISRLALITNDGSERFYRQTKKLVEQNRPRVLAVHLDMTSVELGERLFGPGKRVLFLLINHKDAVIDFLSSLIKKA